MSGPRPGRELVDQPVVFLGSEGETGVVARDLRAFLWLLADGFGPWEAATSYEPEPDWAPKANRDLAAIAEQFAPDRRTSAAAIIAQATQEFPDFDDTIMKLCRGTRPGTRIPSLSEPSPPVSAYPVAAGQRFLDNQLR